MISPVGIRIAGHDFMEGGHTNVEAARFAAAAEAAGVHRDQRDRRVARNERPAVDHQRSPRSLHVSRPRNQKRGQRPGVRIQQARRPGSRGAGAPVRGLRPHLLGKAAYRRPRAPEQGQRGPYGRDRPLHRVQPGLFRFDFRRNVGLLRNEPQSRTGRRDRRRTSPGEKENPRRWRRPSGDDVRGHRGPKGT